jgi:hypothetical protein
VELTNAEVLQGLQTTTFNRLEGCGKNWVDQVPSVLWSLRAMTMRSTGKTLFSLVYGAEVVFPMEVKYGSPRILMWRLPCMIVLTMLYLVMLLLLLLR